MVKRSRTSENGHSLSEHQWKYYCVPLYNWNARGGTRAVPERVFLGAHRESGATLGWRRARHHRRRRHRRCRRRRRSLPVLSPRSVRSIVLWLRGADSHRRGICQCADRINHETSRWHSPRDLSSTTRKTVDRRSSGYALKALINAGKSIWKLFR